MYQSNQARIKKENPSLLPGRGEGPPAGSVAPSQLSLSPAQTLATITETLKVKDPITQIDWNFKNIEWQKSTSFSSWNQNGV